MPVYLDDKRLAKQLLAGNERAFARFFEDNFARLYRFVLARLANDPEGARDVAQITLCRAVRKIHTYRGESALFTWLCAIGRNELHNWLRRQGRYQEHIVLVEDFPEVQASVDSLLTPARQDPERDYERLEALRLIQVALDRLPARYGDALEWKYIQGHSVKEIAVKLDIGTEAAQSLLARAKRAFADVYSTLHAALGDKNRLVKS